MDAFFTEIVKQCNNGFMNTPKIVVINVSWSLIKGGMEAVRNAMLSSFSLDTVPILKEQDWWSLN